MQFLNSWPKFQEFIKDDYQFYIKGKTSLNYNSILDLLRQGSFPNNIKGNFAFYYQDNTRTVIAVDHLPNYQMFYSDHYCGHIFLNVQAEIRKNGFPLTDNSVIWTQTRLFWGGSVGEDTTKKEIKKVPAGCYLEVTPDNKQKIYQYNNIYSQPTGDFNLEELSNIIENFIKENTSDPFAILLSSGTDSNTLFGYFRKLDIVDRCSFISIKGQKEYMSEAPYIQKIADHYNTKIDWLHVGEWNPQRSSSIDDMGYKSAYHRTYSAFWQEPHVLLKYRAIRELGHRNKVIFTGEVGDQIFGSRFGKVLLKFIIQNPNCSVEEIAELFLNCDLTRFHVVSKSVQFSPIFTLPHIMEAYNAAKQWFVETWNKIETDDLVNKIELIQYFYKGSHRVYNCNQFFDLKFAHPFADGDLFNYIWKIPGNYKLANGGKSRSLSYELIKHHMVDWPWNWNKTGVGILGNDNKFQNLKGAYDDVQLALGKRTT